MASKSYRLKIYRANSANRKYRLDFFIWNNDFFSMRRVASCGIWMYVSSSVSSTGSRIGLENNEGKFGINDNFNYCSILVGQNAIGQQACAGAPHRLFIESNHSRWKLMSNWNSTELPHEFEKPRNARVCASVCTELVCSTSFVWIEWIHRMRQE